VSGLRSFLKRLFRQRPEDELSPGFSYKIYWTKTCLPWSQEKRERVQAELEQKLAESSFTRNPYRRAYQLRSIDGRYSGESLYCLAEVLESLSLQGDRGE